MVASPSSGPFSPRSKERRLAAQLVAPASEVLPVAQLLQLFDDFAPVVVRYLPTTQSVHSSKPVSAAYVPAAQLVHTVAAMAEYLPATQFTQLASFELPSAADAVPTGHGVQPATSVVPAAMRYLPAAQLVHATADAAETLPATQFVHADAPANENFPAAQPSHEVASAKAANFPAAHLVHKLEVAAAYLPAAHMLHAVNPATAVY